MNIVLAFAILFFVYFVNAQQVDQKVGEIRPGSPAAKVLQPGDRIVAVDGKSYSGLDQEARIEHFGKTVGAHECAGKQVQGCLAATPVTLTISRDGQVKTISVRPEYNKAAKRALIGFSYGSKPEDISAGTAATRAVDSIWLVTHKTASIFSRIFEAEQRKQISASSASATSPTRRSTSASTRRCCCSPWSASHWA